MSVGQALKSKHFVLGEAKADVELAGEQAVLLVPKPIVLGVGCDWLAETVEEAVKVAEKYPCHLSEDLDESHV
jgi:hypothetical protein